MTKEKAIELLKEIIDEGWLISDFEKCPAIDACEMAIEALEQEPILDKIRAEIEQEPYISKMEVLDILDKYKAESENP